MNILGRGFGMARCMGIDRQERVNLRWGSVGVGPIEVNAGPGRIKGLFDGSAMRML